ncbi:SCP-like protein [Ancylostoma caninum]|uniref:SCP-like protein n=1 Tax=Ancylostoma caninum TaxID=29170 RepID=A0A368F4U2_ANCCA|nr:SCP-like protein [Ancylostoma caninum]
MEESARQHALKCQRRHSNNLLQKDLGENLFYSSLLQKNKVETAIDAPRSWFWELIENGLGQENVLRRKIWDRPGKPIGHYTQMVWQDSYKLGCYVHWCDYMTIATCHYGPQGNLFGVPIYEVGDPCTTDDDCDCDDCTCSREEALCIVH